MRDSRSCPPDLIAHASRGPDGPAAERISAHLRQCRSCRRELALAQALKHEFAGYSGVEDLSRRVAAAVAGDLARTNPRTPRRQRRGTAWYMLAAAMILVSMAAIAAEYPTIKRAWGPRSSSGDLSTVGTTPPLTSTVAGTAEETPVASPAPLDDRPGSPAPLDDRPVAPPPVHGSTPSAQIIGSVGGSSGPTARELFTSANIARRHNDGSRASSLYRELQRRYPTSVEALVSRVSFGRILLDNLGDPAGALVQFDGYLAQTAHVALAEEALFGRAMSLSRLGRLETERETWRTLLARYPSSIYAERARVRMGAVQ
jgi:hypothetical protein